MKLGELLRGVPTLQVGRDLDPTVKSLAYDSRRVKPGTLFFAIRGAKADGHSFTPQALHQGAGEGRGGGSPFPRLSFREFHPRPSPLPQSLRELFRRQAQPVRGFGDSARSPFRNPGGRPRGEANSGTAAAPPDPLRD